MSVRKTTAEFISEAVAIHGSNYCYRFTEYCGARTKVKIYCNKHNQVFYQEPLNHLQGHGCPLCGDLRGKISRCSTTADFIDKAKLLHAEGDLDYSKVLYVNSRTPVVIVCQKHGEFKQIPSHHLQGSSCPACAVERNAVKLRMLQEDWVRLASQVHANKYSYDFVDYLNSSTKINITCEEHGIFTQTPSFHIAGGGCPSCAQTGFDKNSLAFVYVVGVGGGCVFTGYGITKDNRKRNTDHTRKLKEHGCFIDKMFSTPCISGHKAHELETLLKQTFPLATCSKDIPGFKTESTSTDYATVVAFVEDYITKNKQETTWQHST